jgi:hypothetical protein
MERLAEEWIADTSCATIRMTGLATMSFAKWFGNGMSGVNLPFNGKYLSNLLG